MNPPTNTEGPVTDVAAMIRLAGSQWVVVPREPTRSICEAIEKAMLTGRTDHAWTHAIAAIDMAAGAQIADAKPPAKFVAPGTVIMRRSDVMGVVHKRIAQLHVEARDVGEHGSILAFSAVRHKIAAYKALLSDLRELPDFTNATPSHLTEQGATAS